MSDSESESQGGVKIVDRRRFDQDGNVKKAEGHEEAKEAQSKSEAAKAKPIAAESTSEAREINFSSFVISLATQALMQLGHVAAPEGVEIAVDREAAKQTIDILIMLESKTKGNLAPDEAKLLEEILHNLRLSYVKVV